MAQTGIYAILDKVAGMILGGLHLFKHDAAAVRFFGDIAVQENSQIGRHPQDYQLLKIGSLDVDESKITTEDEQGPTFIPSVVVLEGAAWAAMYQTQKESTTP